MRNMVLDLVLDFLGGPGVISKVHLRVTIQSPLRRAEVRAQYKEGSRLWFEDGADGASASQEKDGLSMVRKAGNIKK